MRSRLLAVAALVAVLASASLAPQAVAAPAAAIVEDPAGDVVSLGGDPAAVPATDIVEFGVDVGDALTIELTFDAAHDVSRHQIIVVFVSPWGGGGSLLIASDGFGLFPTADVDGINLDGTPSVCDGSTIQGDGTTTITLTVLPTCVNPPADSFVSALVISDEFAVDAVNDLALVTGNGSGAPTRAGLYDGDPSTTVASVTTDPVAAAVAASQGLYPDGWFSAVITSDQVFADALSASSLLLDHGPLLFTDAGALPAATRDELSRVLTSGNEVLVLGGTGAIDDVVLDEITALGFRPRRIAGETRIATSLAVARERLQSTFAHELILARSAGPAGARNGSAAWADAIAIAPYSVGTTAPVVLVGGELTDAHRDLLDRQAFDLVTILGGDSAVSNDIEAELRLRGDVEVRRVAGDDRAATAAAIARMTYEIEDPLANAGFLDGPRPVAVLNGFADDGWAHGLANAAVAINERAPFLLVSQDILLPATAELVRGCGDEPGVEVWVLGGKGQVSSSVLDEIDARDASGDPCPAFGAGGDDSDAGDDTSPAATRSARADDPIDRWTPILQRFGVDIGLDRAA